MAQLENTQRPTQRYAPAKIWADYRRLMDGQAFDVADEHVREHIPKAAAEGRVRVKYYDLHHYVWDVASGAMDLPFRITGESRDFIALMERWRPMLAQAWKIRFAPGSAYPHVLLHRDRLVLEHIWGDRKEIKADPQAPTEWDLVREFKYSTGEDRAYVYMRDDKGNIWTSHTADNGRQEPANGAAEQWGVLPVYPMYLRATSSLEPIPDRGLLDMFRALSLQASDIEFRRGNRVGILYIRRDDGGATKVFGGAPVENNPDRGVELGESDQIGLVESSLSPVDDIQYNVEDLKLWAKLKRIPPDLFDIGGSRAETGAAKSFDAAPLLALQQQDRAAADRWLADFVAYIRPILVNENVIGPEERVTVKTVASKRGAESLSLAHVQAVVEAAKAGMWSMAREISLREGVSMKTAQNILRENLKERDKTGMLDVSGGAPTTPPAGPAAAVEA